MKTKDYFKSTTFFYNNLFLKNILDYKLTLNEFILLNYFINMHIVSLDLNKAQEATCLDAKMILEAYNGLIEKKIISIVTSSDKNGVVEESISLESFINKLDENVKTSHTKNTIDDLVSKYNEYSNSKATDNEIEIIKAWFDEGYTFDKILSCFEESKYNGVFNIRYIDKLLHENKASSEVNNTSNDKLFDYDWLDEK